MNTIFSKKIDTTLEAGRYLGDFNIDNWALTKQQALDILNKFKDLQVGLAGGDVIKEENGVFGFTGDSWHCNRQSEEQYTICSASPILHG